MKRLNEQGAPAVPETAVRASLVSEPRERRGAVGPPQASV